MRRVRAHRGGPVVDGERNVRPLAKHRTDPQGGRRLPANSDEAARDRIRAHIVGRHAGQDIEGGTDRDVVVHAGRDSDERDE